MSTSSDYGSVRSVRSTPAAAAPHPLASILGALVAEGVRALAEEALASAASRPRVSASPREVRARSAAALQAKRRALQANTRGLEAERQAALASLADVPVAPQLDATRLHAEVEALRAAPTAEAITAAHAALVEKAASLQAPAFMDDVVDTCRRALQSRDVGLRVEHVVLGESLDGARTIVASDAEGRGVACEIRSRGGDVRLEVEIIGVGEPDCAAVMDRVERALADEGLEAAAPRRRGTGGRAQLRAAQRHVARLLAPRPASAPPPTDAAPPRAPRLRTKS